MRLIVLVVVALGLLVGGCEQKREPVTQKTVQTEPEAATSVAEQAKTAVDETVQQVSAAVVAGEEKLQQVGATAKQAVQEGVEVAATDLAAGAVVAQEKATQAVEAVQQQASAVQEDGGKLLNSLVEKAVNTAPAVESVRASTQEEVVPAGNDLIANVVVVATEVVSAPAQPVATLVIKNTKGDVTLTHAQHGEKYGCVVCHGDGVPAAFELGKDRAHKLCKDCHKQNTGPVSCAGCHVK